MAAETSQSRSLLFSDGSSNKFWNIELDGTSHTVRFGRVGTDGQTRTKDFDSEEDAKKSYDKLVAEKLKKGYEDPDGDSSDTKAVSTKSKTTIKKTTQTAATKKKSTKKDEVKASIAKSAVSKAEVDLNVTHEIDLEARDWFRATFRSNTPLERGEPAPFDQEDCVRRLSKLKTAVYGWVVRWSDLKLPEVLSPEEAHFWFDVTTKPRNREDPMKDFAAQFSKQTYTGKIDLETALETIASQNRHADGSVDYVSLALANLVTPQEYCEIVLRLPEYMKENDSYETSPVLWRLISGFNTYVLPYLTEQQITKLRKLISKSLDPTCTPAVFSEMYPPGHYLAASLGMHDAVLEITSNWSDDLYQENEYFAHYQKPQDIVVGLGSAELVEAEWRRLKLEIQSEKQLRAFLACTEFAALDYVAQSVNKQPNKESCESLLKVFTLVRAPEAALPMLECKLSCKLPAVARDWLDKYVGNAVTGLLEVAAGRGKLADEALDYLRTTKRKGYESVIVAALKKADKSEVSAKIQSEVIDREEKTFEPLDAKSTPKWLAKELAALDTLKPRKVPGWASAAMLPPLVVGDHCLNDEQVTTLVQVLVATPSTERHPLLVAVRENVTPMVRDEFAWKLFQQWSGDGCVSKEKWAMGAIGHLGDDSSVLKLTPMIRVWPGESQHQRAVFGLQCLRAVGSTTALMQLSSIGQKLKFKGLKAKAQEFVQEIANERGLTRHELEDRVVPECGLDENGCREFSFGPRSFSFVLGSDMKAMIRDAKGKVRPNLPSPGVNDDQDEAAQSVAEWKLIKKQIKEVATLQAGRLEQAMVTGRRWSVKDFETLLVKHPLLTHLVQKLIWLGYDEKGKQIVSFRVTEERDYADADDNAIKLDNVASIGVAHPLEMTEQERSRWGEVMSDYEIISPFPQLGRPVYTLEKGEDKTDDLTRLHGIKLAAPTMVFTLEKLGWVRGVAMDGGCFDEYSKQFPGADATAVVHYDGVVGMGYIDPDEILTTDSIHFCKGIRSPSVYGWNSEKKLKLSKVPPIVISEVIADLQVLKSKVK
ncbi:DUF4132 domain-containing protein [Bremerella cremea]|uniref:DUF4132 domain-containing protein n=1 Tax=Bremerella cremea TaxID=1031537 RepID=A0A368KTN6_9BACT|nr:DUF4132 domain-containing protein [Bremerella cremea]RCS49470.1 DUF4132 domain-containing protein [Bremerella cremea]